MPSCLAGPATTAIRTTSLTHFSVAKLVGGNNRSQWCNEEFNALVKKAKVTSDQAERTKLYEEAQTVFKREAPWATLDHSLSVVPMRRKSPVSSRAAR